VAGRARDGLIGNRALTGLDGPAPGYGPMVKCGFCLRPPADGVLVRSVNGAYVCTECAARIAACERAAAAPLVVASFAEFFEEWQTSPHDAPRIQLAARRFWSELTCFEEISGSIDVLGALTMLAATAPSRSEPSP
jgi:hypothetical protein